jgi:N-methylhydantoinase A
VGPGNFAAFGSLISDIRHHTVRTRTLQTRQVRFAEILGEFRRMEKEATARLAGEGVAGRDMRFVRSLGMRYLGQSWELEVELPREINSIGRLEAAFAEVHQRRFGHRNEDPTEIVNFQLAAIGQVGKPRHTGRGRRGTLKAARTGRREVYFSGAFRATAVYERERLPAGARLTGPAIIEESGATTVVPPRWRARVLAGGELMLERT